MPTKLSAIVARVDDVHQRNMKEILGEHQHTRTPALYTGQVRTYQPLKEDATAADHQPEKRDNVQVSAYEQLDRIYELHQEMWNLAAQRDKTNQTAMEDVIVDGNTLIPQAPVQYMLYLEKHLTDLLTFIKHLPVRDPAETWTHDESADVWKTEPIESQRTEKVPHVIVLAKADQYHPQQQELHWQDEPVGIYRTTKMSNALSTVQKRAYMARVTKVIDALKEARARANSAADVADYTPAADLVAYLWPER